MSEISLLLKGLKFVSTSIRIDKTKFKHRLEVFEKKLKSMQHFRKNDSTFDGSIKFRPKCTCIPKARMLLQKQGCYYLSSEEEMLLDIDVPQDKFNNLSKEERRTRFLWILCGTLKIIKKKLISNYQMKMFMRR